jgi:hypothetical protein
VAGIAWCDLCPPPLHDAPALQTLPARLTIGPGWVIPAMEAALLIPLTVRAPYRHREVGQHQVKEPTEPGGTRRYSCDKRQPP